MHEREKYETSRGKYAVVISSFIVTVWDVAAVVSLHRGKVQKLFTEPYLLLTISPHNVDHLRLKLPWNEKYVADEAIGKQ